MSVLKIPSDAQMDPVDRRKLSAQLSRYVQLTDPSNVMTVLVRLLYPDASPPNVLPELSDVQMEPVS